MNESHINPPLPGCKAGYHLPTCGTLGCGGCEPDLVQRLRAAAEAIALSDVDGKHGWTCDEAANLLQLPVREGSTEPLPCPFCGHGDSIETYHDPKTILHPWYRIECGYCGAKGPGSDRGDHLEMWNQRAAAEKR